MIICEQPRLIFLAVPRTASTAITRSIEKAFPDCEKFGQHRMQIPGHYPQDRYFVFAGARNPYARVVSHYLHRFRTHPLSVGLWTFTEYVQNMVRNRLRWWGLSGDPPAVKWVQGTGCTHFIRYEQLEADWAALPAWQDLDTVPRLMKANANPEKYDWRHFYTQDLARKVYDHQRADFDFFGYEKDEWRPAFARQQEHRPVA